MSIVVEPCVIYDSRRLADDFDLAEWEARKVQREILDLVGRHEKRYKTVVEDLVLAGEIGTWRGTFFGGVVVRDMDSIFSSLGKMDDIEVRLVGDDIEVVGYHHDGKNRFRIFPVTSGRRRALGLSSDSRGWEIYEIGRVAKTFPPLRADKKFRHAFGL